MAFSVNKVTLLGNLGQDAETRFTQDGRSVTNFSVATARSYKGKNEEWVNETTWHNVVAWRLSDFHRDALKKGAKVYVEGRIAKRDYTDKENIKRYVTEVVCENLIPLDGKGEGGFQQQSSYQQSQNNNVVSEPFNSPQDKVDDDLPF